jgi:hypothetical protein
MPLVLSMITLACVGITLGHVQGDIAMMIDSEVASAVIHNIAVGIFIVILYFAFVGLVILLDWLFTCVLDCFNIFSDLEQNKKEKRNGQL